MAPCVRRHLVSVVVHVPHNFIPLLVNGALAKIVAGNEESSTASLCLKLPHDGFSVDERSIVVCDGYCTGIFAGVDARSTVGNAAKFGPGNVACACARWGLVGVASRAVVEQAVGCFAVIFCSSAVAVC